MSSNAAAWMSRSRVAFVIRERDLFQMGRLVELPHLVHRIAVDVMLAVCPANERAQSNERVLLFRWAIRNGLNTTDAESDGAAKAPLNK